MHSIRWARAAAVATALVVLPALAAGCSSGRPPPEVQGQVTFKGKPVAEGSVTFLNTTEGGTAGADLKPDGTFVVPGRVFVGDYQVVVTPPVTIVDTDPGRSPPAPVEKNMPNIPAKYRM